MIAAVQPLALSLFAALALAVVPSRVAQAAAIHASSDPVRDERPITPKDREHWAWQPLPSMPSAVPDLAELSRELDRLSGAAGPVVDDAALRRRLAFGLTGLPPAETNVSGDVAAYVQALLDSPAYGQHWAQWWLDLARYAETDGFEHDRERPGAWRYRDWVIDALNRDLPFDQFVQQQIAGDLLPNGQAIATGFLFAGPDMPDINNQTQRRHVVLTDITGTVGSVFLGLSIGCAQCHDHPYDPLSQADFHRLRAFFDNTVVPVRDKQLGPSVKVFDKEVPPSVVYVRGDVTRPGPAVSPALPRLVHAGETRERAALAQWLGSRDNALLLRAMASRVWQQHFGTALTPAADDLGRLTGQPSNPKLLDWLAAQLPRLGWSLKRLHTVIVLSQTYRQAALPPRRLTGEMLRDAMLTVAGTLNPQAGGESVLLPLPAEIRGTLLKKHIDKTPASPADLARRSIYAFARRNARQPIFDLFDRPDALASCARRNESTTAPQALALLNSDFTQQTARALAERLHQAHGSDAEAIARAAIPRCWGRQAADEEVQLARSFLSQQTAKTQDFVTALQDYCLALLNANEFLLLE